MTEKLIMIPWFFIAQKFCYTCVLEYCSRASFIASRFWPFFNVVQKWRKETFHSSMIGCFILILQKLVLHPDVFQKFEKLSLDPPLYYADINVILEKLKYKKVKDSWSFVSYYSCHSMCLLLIVLHISRCEIGL